jgi:predicted dithiol-disulfide oxidoreductase (DUF899 family)
MAQLVTGAGTREHRVVSEAEWLVARKELLAREKEFTRLRGELNRQRRELPWVKVEKEYSFDGLEGKETLSGLFGNKSQLIVYHFMFSPEWKEGCRHCSFWADHYDSTIPHLRQRDVSFVVISRAPMSILTPFQKRMGWKFKWLSSGDTDFNYDFQASFRPEDIKRGSVFYNYRTEPMDMTDREGISVFYKDEAGAIFHTYSCYARGIDMVNTTYHFLDLVPKGRDEDPPNFPQDWVHYHDRYRD